MTIPLTPELTIIVAALCWGLAAMSLLTVVRSPSYFFWKPAVAATEWGHWLAAISFGVGFGGFVLAGLRWNALPAAVAAVLFMSPSFRAAVLTRRLPSRVDRVFGVRPSLDQAQDRYGSRKQNVPLSIPRFINIPIPRIERTSLVYRETDDVRLTLDLYLEPDMDLRSKAQVVLVVHGGSWSSGDNSQLTGMNRYLASRGYAVAALNYRLAPRHRFPAPVEDVFACIDSLPALGARFGFSPDGVVLLGRSSGGHIALSAAYARRRPRSNTVRGVIALYAPTDLVWSWARPAPRRLLDSNAAIRQFLGGTPDDIPTIFEAASPIQQVSRDSPPTLLIHGRKDEIVSPLQSSRLSAALAAVGARQLHVELPWGCHGMDANLAGPSGQISLYLIERFLASVWSREEVSVAGD